MNTVATKAPGHAGADAGAETAATRYRLPTDASSVDMLDVQYTHLKTQDGGDLYLTSYGLRFWEHLLPENWYAKGWFEAKRERLEGTSTAYRLPTRSVQDVPLDLMVKWSRVGEEIPITTLTVNKFIDAEFNSPFEEFALVLEMRAGRLGSPNIRIRTQKPLGIYVPSERLQLWETGRSEAKIAAKVAKSPGVEIDILRQYVLLYGWIKGMDLVEAAEALKYLAEERKRLFANVTSLATCELENKGYRVVDMKPEHVIVRLNTKGELLRDHDGRIVYAVVDYELLERTPQHQSAVMLSHRRHYLQHMARRFEPPVERPFPPHLKLMNILGVDYIYGHAESTGGHLWVVGRDPDLFNYFLPERWRRTSKQKLSEDGQVYRTRTKDNVHMVWRVSRLGERASPGDSSSRAQAIRDYGFNSPFEEFAYALNLTSRGVATVYPRAIYMTGHRSSSRAGVDIRHYETGASLTAPDGHAVLSQSYDYITVWGFWNGPDEFLAAKDGRFFTGINAEKAKAEGLISEETLASLLAETRRRLEEAGFRDLNLKADHIMVSKDPGSRLVTDPSGKPAARLCNFELMAPIARPGARQGGGRQ